MNDEDIKAQINALIRDEIQEGINDYLDAKEADKEKQSTQDYKLGLDIAKDLVKDINLNE